MFRRRYLIIFVVIAIVLLVAIGQSEETPPKATKSIERGSGAVSSNNSSDQERAWLLSKIQCIYVVQKMSNGWLPWGGMIARYFQVLPKQLYHANNHIGDWDHLKIGSVIFTPKGSAADYWVAWEQNTRSTYVCMIRKMDEFVARHQTIAPEKFVLAKAGQIFLSGSALVNGFGLLDQSSSKKYPNLDIWSFFDLAMVFILVLTLALCLGLIAWILWQYWWSTTSASSGGARSRQQPSPPPALVDQSTLLRQLRLVVMDQYRGMWVTDVRLEQKSGVPVRTIKVMLAYSNNMYLLTPIAQIEQYLSLWVFARHPHEKFLLTVQAAVDAGDGGLSNQAAAALHLNNPQSLA